MPVNLLLLKGLLLKNLLQHHDFSDVSWTLRGREPAGRCPSNWVGIATYRPMGIITMKFYELVNIINQRLSIISHNG